MIVQTMYMAKSPEGGTGVALHQDTHYIRNEPNTLMACWVALSDTDRNNGGLCVVPGSHTRPLYDTSAACDTAEHASWKKDYAMRGPDGNEWVEEMHSHPRIVCKSVRDSAAVCFRDALCEGRDVGVSNGYTGDDGGVKAESKGGSWEWSRCR